MTKAKSERSSLLSFASMIPYDLWHPCLLGQKETDSLHGKGRPPLVWTNGGTLCCSHFHCLLLFTLSLIRISPLSYVPVQWKHPLNHLQRRQCDMTSTNCNKTMFSPPSPKKQKKTILLPIPHRNLYLTPMTYAVLAYVVSCTFERQRTLFTDTHSSVSPIKHHLCL